MRILKKPLPIGIENYKEIIDKDYYYVDKTRMIRDLLERGSKVNLFTRPRRFGKTLALSMLKAYFETGTDHCHYFEGMKIMQEKKYICQMGQYPVIFLLIYKL